MYFEDIAVGERVMLGDYTFTEAQMIAFARKYDPQPFHVDPEAARASIHGGLIASGWMTAAIWMKLMTARRALRPSGPAVSPGFEDLRWWKPVRPGMTLAFFTEAVEKRAWPTQPGFGLVINRSGAEEQDGTPVLSMTTKVLIGKKGSTA
jgi:acyl dehydratase